MDPQSLDAAVQNTLSGLFPPFDVTAPTVLSQLFRVLEAKYHGDGLCCLLDFLIPSKRLLEHVRQAACAPYCSCVFLHEGWPLCLHEKVVVHLSPLNPLLLRPGDFYLQAEPCGEQSARLVVKCLSRDLTTVEKIPVPEASCALLFTEEWLEEINRDLDWPALHTCLVATGNGIAPAPWSKIATPEFVQIPKTEGLAEQESSDGTDTCCRLNSQRQNCRLAGAERSSPKGSVRSAQGKYPGLIKVDQGSWKKSTLFVVPSLCDIISENLEGEYVNLLEFSEEKKLDFSSPAKSTVSSAPQLQPQGEVSPRTQKGLVWVNGVDEATTEDWSCGKGPSSEQGPCTPCLRRKLNQDPGIHEPRCRYRESYVAALRNPVSFSSGLMAAILEEMDVAKQASHSDSTDVQPPEGSGQAAPRILSEHPDKDRKVEEASTPGPLKPLKSPTECPVASNKFSFLKGHRQLSSSGGGLSAPENSTKRQAGPRKRTPIACSPRTARVKPAAAAAAGKGTSQVDAVSLEPLTQKGMDSADALLKECPLLGSSPQELVQWESLSPELLSSGVVCLPGNTDKLGRPVVQITTSGGAWGAPWCSAREVTRLLLYLLSLSKKQSNDQGLTVVIDARREPPSATLSAALGSVQNALPGSIHAVLLLAEKEAASHLERLPGMQVELLSSLKALGRHVDSSQLTQALDGPFPYCHSEWVQYFQKMHRFVSDLSKASELLQSTTQELEQGPVPETLQAVGQQMEKHRQLMQDVLCNAQLVSLQREGGALLARLRKEAARLSFSPDVRNSVACALALYNLVEEEVHTLVTKSNHRLEHLEFLSKIRELEAEFSKLSSWFDERGEPELCEVGAAEDSRESTEESYWRFKEFFKEATVHYNRGLSLSKEAARIQGPRFPEMGAFEAAKGAFQAKLTMFYMDMEMKGAELETSLDLYRFCDKVTQFNLDCKQGLALWTSRKDELRSTEARQEAEKSLQWLSEEFSAERFQQMKIQASSMRNENGLVVWREALQRCQEARQILEETVATFTEVPGGGSRDCGENSSAFSSDPNPAPQVPGDDPCFDGASVKPKKQEEVPPEGSRRNEDGSVGSTGVCDSLSQEAPLCGGPGKDGKGSEEASPECGVPEAQDPDEEASEHLQTTTQSSPLTLPAPTSHPNVKQVPGACESLPSTKPPCVSVPARGQRSRKREAAQYFQLSRHGSFSSEDTDSQNSAEGALGSSATLPMESPGPKGAWTQERVLGILYLENHSTNSLAHAASQ